MMGLKWNSFFRSILVCIFCGTFVIAVPAQIFNWKKKVKENITLESEEKDPTSILLEKMTLNANVESRKWEKLYKSWEKKSEKLKSAYFKKRYTKKSTLIERFEWHRFENADDFIKFYHPKALKPYQKLRKSREIEFDLREKWLEQYQREKHLIAIQSAPEKKENFQQIVETKGESFKKMNEILLAIATATNALQRQLLIKVVQSEQDYDLKNFNQEYSPFFVNIAFAELDKMRHPYNWEELSLIKDEKDWKNFLLFKDDPTFAIGNLYLVKEEISQTALNAFAKAQYPLDFAHLIAIKNPWRLQFLEYLLAQHLSIPWFWVSNVWSKRTLEGAMQFFRVKIYRNVAKEDKGPVVQKLPTIVEIRNPSPMHEIASPCTTDIVEAPAGEAILQPILRPVLTQISTMLPKLKNLGQTCFANSAHKMLAAVIRENAEFLQLFNPLTHPLKKWSLETPLAFSARIKLQDYFYKLLLAISNFEQVKVDALSKDVFKNLARTLHLRGETLGQRGHRLMCQQFDAHEYLTKIFEYMEQEKFPIVTVNFSKNLAATSVQKLLQNLLKKSENFPLPSELLLQLNRFHFDKNSKKTSKVKLPVTIDTKLTFENSDVNYFPRAVVVHRGDKTDEGHYYIYLWEGDHWVVHNDDKIYIPQQDFAQADMQKNAYLIYFHKMEH